MPGVANPAGMTISYGAGAERYTFPVSVQPPSIKLEPVYDSAGRTVAAVRYTIDLTAIVYPAPGDIDASIQMSFLRQKLSRPACELNISETGFGDLVVNRQGGRVWDCEWGPKPAVLSCDQIGDILAWKVAWRCVAVVPEECPPDTSPLLGRVYEWCYGVRWSVDERGLTRRTISGHVKIPITRLKPESITLPDNADRMREAVKNLRIPEGFRRVPGDTDLSEDRRTLNFSVVDEQLPSANSPPPNVTHVTATHSMSNANARNFFSWTHQLAATYTMGRDQPKSLAWVYFQEMYEKLRATARAGAGGFKHFVVPLSLSVSDDLYEQKTSFRLTYTAAIAGGQKIDTDAAKRKYMEQVLGASGMWLPPPQSDWDDWAVSLNSTAFDARGYAGLKYSNADGDLLVNVCVTPRKLSTGPLPGGRILRGKLPGGGNYELSTKPGGGKAPKVSPFVPGAKPSPDNSWLRFKADMKIVRRDEVAHLKLLPNREVMYSPPVGGDVDARDGYTADYAPGRKATVIQYRAEPAFVVVWEGFALRAGHAITPPRLAAVGGVKAHPLNDDDCYFNSEVAGDLLTPIVAARWRFKYVLEDTPAQAIGPPKGNPMFEDV